MSQSFAVFLNDIISQNALKAQMAIDKISQSVNNVTSSFQRFSSLSGNSINQLRQKLQSLETAKGAETSIAGIRRLNREIRQTETQIKKLDNLPPKSFASRIGDAGKALGSLIGVSSGLDIVSASWGAFTGIAKLGMDAQDARIKFETFLGSGGKAQEMLADITQYANNTPFVSSDLQQSAEQMLKYGVAGEKIMPTIKMLGNISRGNKNQLSELSLAFGQVSSHGKLMEQSLSQMTNAGFNPLAVISENTGISMGKLKEQMNAGMISVNMVEEAFKLATGPGGKFNGMLEKVNKSASVQLSNALENIQSKLAVFGEKYIVPIIGSLAVMANEFFNSFDGMGKIIQPFLDTLKPLWDTIAGFINSFFGLNDATSGTSAVISFLNKTLGFLTPILTVIVNGITGAIAILTPFAPLIKMIAIAWGLWNAVLVVFKLLIETNPFGLIIGAIVILIGLIVTAWQRFETFRAVIMGAWEAIKGFGLMIKDYIINRLKELLTGITGIGQALMYLFEGEFSKAWDAGKKAAGDLLGIGSASKLIEDGKKIAGEAGAAYNATFNKKIVPQVAKTGAKTKEKTAAVTAAPSSKQFDILGKGEKNKSGKTGAEKSISKSSDGIIGGGPNATNITLNVAKMQDQIVINTVNAGEGASKIRQIIEEELNRLLGSISQMQTA